MTEKPKLTHRQQQVYDFIAECIHSRGYGPTVREIGNKFGIKSPNGVMCHLQALVKKGLINREGKMSRAISLVRDEYRDNRSVPLEGVIAAGTPVEAFEDVERIDFGEMFTGEGNVCLKVRGDSMIDDHIADGDYVIIRKQSTAQNGQIVVALVDGAETTLKRFYRDRDRFRLEPANAALSPIYSNDVQILGLMIGVVRRVG